MSDQFEVTFPCYSFLDENGIAPHPVSGGSTGQSAFLMFTDWDLADEFRKEQGLVGAALRFDIPEQIMLYMDSLNKRVDCITFEAIAFDINVSRSQGVFVSFHEFLAKLPKRDD